MCRPFRALSFWDAIPRAALVPRLPWAGLLPGLWLSFRVASKIQDRLGVTAKVQNTIQFDEAAARLRAEIVRGEDGARWDFRRLRRCELGRFNRALGGRGGYTAGIHRR